jgi:sporulation protein YlmC with PRC-barrel domain
MSAISTLPTASSHDAISAEGVQGTTVYGPDGTKLGTIDGLMINKLSGQVRYAVLACGGFLGVGTDRYPLPWSMLRFDTRLDGYLVPLTREQLAEAPRHDVDELPHYTETEGRRVHSYYGVEF